MKSFRRFVAVSLVALFGAALVAGPATAAEPRGKTYKAPLRAITVGNLITAAADELNVEKATLVDAIRDAANERVTKAADRGVISERRAARLKARIANSFIFAMRISRTRSVAANLKVTPVALNQAFRNARKTLALQRIEAALAAGKITEAQAKALKNRLAHARMPGYKAFFGFGFWIGGFRHLPTPA